MINLQEFSKKTFVVTLLISVVVAALIFNSYTKKKYNESIFTKKV